jgi:ADP-ribose pyrophosphatase YjhB (NUDIX family)
MLYLYVFGSSNKFRQLKKHFDDNKYQLIFIDGQFSKSSPQTKTTAALYQEFQNHYSFGQKIIGFISFAKGSLTGNIEMIAATFAQIKRNFPQLSQLPFIGPSKKAAQIFNHKLLTFTHLSRQHIPVVKTLCLNLKQKKLTINKITFPCVVKVASLSGGRVMKYVRDKKQLRSAITQIKVAGFDHCLVTEYIRGIEITFTLLRLGECFCRLPPSYKKPTTTALTHPDDKVKICGLFGDFEENYLIMERLMRQYDIYGLFSFQGVLIKKNNHYQFVVLETATRMTGSLPIMAASLCGFDFYHTLALFLKQKKLEFAYQKRLAIQFSINVSCENKPIIASLSKKHWIVETKYEDLSKLAHSSRRRKRLRISFFIEDEKLLEKRLTTIAKISHCPQCLTKIPAVLTWFKRHHPQIYCVQDKKLLSGTWSQHVSWEFYLSSFLPPTHLITAVFALPLVGSKIALTKNIRGWELPGGHVEVNETIAQALKREVFEEIGMRISRFMVFGYRKIIATQPQFDPQGKPYPYPISYLPYFLVVADDPLAQPVGKEIITCQTFSFSQTNTLKSSVGKIINQGAKHIQRIN